MHYLHCFERLLVHSIDDNWNVGPPASLSRSQGAPPIGPFFARLQCMYFEYYDLLLIFNWVRYDIIIDTELKPWLIEVHVDTYQYHKYNRVTIIFCAYHYFLYMIVWLCVRLMRPPRWPTPHTVTVSWNPPWLMMSSTLCCRPLDSQSKACWCFVCNHVMTELLWCLVLRKIFKCVFKVKVPTCTTTCGWCKFSYNYQT